MIPTSMKDFLELIMYVLPTVLMVLTVHEFGHAFAAYKMGDETAKSEGRLSLNPLTHIDPAGLLALILFRFGWGKPVPVDFMALRNLRWGMIITSIAGPLSNFIFAGVASVILRLLSRSAIIMAGFPYILYLLQYVIIFNIYLGIFNLVPIPPLDGSKIVFALTKRPTRYLFDETLNFYGMIFLIAILLIPIFRFQYFLSKVIQPLINFLL